MGLFLVAGFTVNLLLSGISTGAEGPKPVPLMQALPLPNYETSFQRDGVELTRYHYGPGLRRPFLYPIVGRSGRSLTRMGHPHDPESHSHHNSVWISHNDVNGVSFWDDRAKGRIAHRRIERFEDGAEEASVSTVNEWLTTNSVLVIEKHVVTVRTLPNDEWFLLLDLLLESKNAPVTFGKTPFGLAGVRLAKSIGVHDGGGRIRNSEGGVNESGVLWKRAKWVDYSGAIKPGVIEGVTLLDHPTNPNHPTFFHVRNDGWMGASLTHDAPRTVEKPLRLRYGLYVHRESPSDGKLNEIWNKFTNLPLPSFNRQR